MYGGARHTVVTQVTIVAARAGRVRRLPTYLEGESMRSRLWKCIPAIAVASLAVGSSAQAQCAAGFTAFGASCYAATSTSFTWQAALAEAQGYTGGSLVAIGSLAENSFVRTTFANLGSVWIGFNDILSEGNFVWANGEPVVFTNWNGGEPNNVGANGEHVTELLNNGAWNDLSASNSRYGIIEVAATSTVPEPMTVTLMATGLLGVMGVGYSRRRKGAA
jgi:hypothetical protein